MRWSSERALWPSDNPRLTVREVEGSNPVRVILDPDGRLDPDRHVFSDGAARTLVVRRQLDEDARPSACRRRPDDPRQRRQTASIREWSSAMLRDAGYRRVLIEGGGITVSRFVQAGVVDRLHVTVAPLLIGSGRPALTLSDDSVARSGAAPAMPAFPSRRGHALRPGPSQLARRSPASAPSPHTWPS